MSSSALLEGLVFMLWCFIRLWQEITHLTTCRDPKPYFRPTLVDQMTPRFKVIPANTLEGFDWRGYFDVMACALDGSLYRTEAAAAPLSPHAQSKRARPCEL